MTAAKTDKVAEFHAHLDSCKRCASQPFNLCAAGQQLLEAAANSVSLPAFAIQAATQPKG